MEEMDPIFKEYHKRWYLHLKAKRDFDKLQNSIDSVISELSKTVTEMKEEVSHDNSSQDKMGKLIAKKIDMEERIPYQEMLVTSRKKRVEEKLEELKSSKDFRDIIYYLKFVSKFKVTEIARVINYTREYTYDLISTLRVEMKKIEKEINEQNNH